MGAKISPAPASDKEKPAQPEEDKMDEEMKEEEKPIPPVSE
jgi:hypothetical protein